MAPIGSLRDAPSTGRVPPHNLEAEESVLGSMMISKSAVGDALEILQPEDFYRDAHQKIFEAIHNLFTMGEPSDAITVADELARRGQLEEVGGKPYLHTLVASVPIAANVTFYARIVTDHATLRRLIDAATVIAQEAYDIPDDVESAVNQAEQIMFDVASRRIHQDFQPVRNLLSETMDHIEMLARRQEDVTGIPTGFTDLDLLLSGMQKSNLILVAARPSMGKSTLAVNIAQYVAQHEQLPTVLFSLEMSWMEIVQRMICSEARIDTKKIRSGQMQEAEWRRVSQSVGRIAEAPMYIDDTPAITMGEIRAKCRRLKAKEGALGVVVVDYIQLMQSPRRSENRVQEVSDISRALKILAKELEVPVLAVSQLSRQPEQGGAKPRKPRLADLRESGALEQDADVVMFVYREDYYDKESEKKGEAEIIVEKHRNGPTDTINLAFLGQYTKFENLARA